MIIPSVIETSARGERALAQKKIEYHQACIRGDDVAPLRAGDEDRGLVERHPAMLDRFAVLVVGHEGGVEP